MLIKWLELASHRLSMQQLAKDVFLFICIVDKKNPSSLECINLLFYLFLKLRRS